MFRVAVAVCVVAVVFVAVVAVALPAVVIYVVVAEVSPGCLGDPGGGAPRR